MTATDPPASSQQAASSTSRLRTPEEREAAAVKREARFRVELYPVALPSVTGGGGAGAQVRGWLNVYIYITPIYVLNTLVCEWDH